MTDTTSLIEQKPISDEKRNIKRALNHLEYVSMISRRILEEPMSITKLASELELLDKQAHLARRRMIALFNENLDLSERLALGEEYGHL